jgi:sigma-B regulation protein RsbQ
MSQDYAAWANGFSQAFMGNPDKPDLAAGFAQALRALRPDVALAVIEMILRSDEREDCERLGALGIPTLVMQTRRDVAVPQAASGWLARALRAQWLELDLEGHFPHLLDPALVTRHLRTFLD